MTATAIPQLPRNQVYAASGAVFVFLFFISLLLPLPVQPKELPAIQKQIKNGGYALSKKGQIVYSGNLKKTFIPASTIKLVTSLAALEILGPDHHFVTRFYLDWQKNLYIQGSGDPFFVSEKIEKITNIIREQGITEIHNIILDDSAFALENNTEGSEDSQNPYDAQCAALGVNFNTLPLQIIHKAKVKSSEHQTPYLQIMGEIGWNLSTGTHRVNINAFPNNTSISNTLLYSGQLFQALLEKQNIKVNGEIKHSTVPTDTPLLLNYLAEETVSDLVQSCLFSSSNFMANQLYLAVGVARFGLPATWEKSRKAMKEFIQNSLHLKDTQIHMTEGSGLSSKNRISPEAMILVLEKFKPYISLMPVKNGVKMKSGTLGKSGVFCYAGYFTQKGTISPFVIFLNQQRNRRDQILNLLFRQ